MANKIILADTSILIDHFRKTYKTRSTLITLYRGAYDLSISAITINAGLKRKRKQISIADLFIAATAINNNIPFATLNKKHFERTDSLQIIG